MLPIALSLLKKVLHVFLYKLYALSMQYPQRRKPQSSFTGIFLHLELGSGKKWVDVSGNSPAKGCCCHNVDKPTVFYFMTV